MLTPPKSPSLCPDAQAALSTFHSLDTFCARWLPSGRIAVFDRKGTLLGIADNLSDIRAAVEHLRLAADRTTQAAEAERFALAQRVAQVAALDALELEL